MQKVLISKAEKELRNVRRIEVKTQVVEQAIGRALSTKKPISPSLAQSLSKLFGTYSAEELCPTSETDYETQQLAKQVQPCQLNSIRFDFRLPIGRTHNTITRIF